MPWISGGPRVSPTPRPSLTCPPHNSSLSPTRSGGRAMTLDDILASLFPEGHDVKHDHGLLLGSGPLRAGGRAVVIGVADRTPVGGDEAIRLSRDVLNAMERGGTGPLRVLVDSDSQRMSK